MADEQPTAPARQGSPHQLPLTRTSGTPTREYVLLVSGTMNPPHRGHVQIGLHAAARLRARGHAVRAVCYVPVHDNYMWNKVQVANEQEAGNPATRKSKVATLFYPMRLRCEIWGCGSDS